jgi:hypothetical protein
VKIEKIVQHMDENPVKSALLRANHAELKKIQPRNTIDKFVDELIPEGSEDEDGMEDEHYTGDDTDSETSSGSEIDLRRGKRRAKKTAEQSAAKKSKTTQSEPIHVATTNTETTEEQNTDRRIYIEGDGTNIKTVSPLKLSQLIEALIGPAQVFPLRSALKIICSTAEMAKKLLNVTILGDIKIKTSVPYSVSKPRTERPIQKVIKGVATTITDEEIRQETGALAARRIVRGRGQGATPTTVVVLDFPKDGVRDRVQIGYYSFRTHDYIPVPTRCYKCQKYGHVTRHCRQEEERCSICAGAHSHRECPDKTQKKCANCGGEHEAASSGCPRFITARRVSAVAASTGTSYRDAVTRVAKADAAEKKGLGAPINVQEIARPALPPNGGLKAQEPRPQPRQQRPRLMVAAKPAMKTAETQTDPTEEQMETEAVSNAPKTSETGIQTETAKPKMINRDIQTETSDGDTESDHEYYLAMKLIKNANNAIDPRNNYEHLSKHDLVTEMKSRLNNQLRQAVTALGSTRLKTFFKNYESGANMDRHGNVYPRQ